MLFNNTNGKIDVNYEENITRFFSIGMCNTPAQFLRNRSLN